MVLDEASSSVDKDTDALMQRLIRSEFEGCTVIAVAHRLETVLDFDRIVVMDEGRVVEVGSPAVLLGGRGRFRELFDS